MKNKDILNEIDSLTEELSRINERIEELRYAYINNAKKFPINAIIQDTDGYVYEVIGYSITDENVVRVDLTQHSVCSKKVDADIVNKEYTLYEGEYYDIDRDEIPVGYKMKFLKYDIECVTGKKCSECEFEDSYSCFMCSRCRG